MIQNEDDPNDLRSHLERYLTRTFLTRNQRRGGYVFSPFEAVICDQFENPWQGVCTAMTVKFAIDVAATLHKHLGQHHRLPSQPRRR
jgi:hypothetical protein